MIEAFLVTCARAGEQRDPSFSRPPVASRNPLGVQIDPPDLLVQTGGRVGAGVPVFTGMTTVRANASRVAEEILR